MRVEIADLGLNNLGSMLGAISRVFGGEVRVIKHRSESLNPDLLVLPGTGSFSSGISSMNTRGFTELVSKHVAEGRFLLAVCLGMQMLCEESEESPGVSGLGLIQAKVRRIRAHRIPNIGWHNVRWPSSSIFARSEASESYYFMHSFAIDAPIPQSEVSFIGTSNYVAGFQSSQIFASQFHPERSSFSGERFLRVIESHVASKL